MTIPAPARPVREFGELRADFRPQPTVFEYHRPDGCTENADTCPNAYHICAECHGVDDRKRDADVNLTKLEAALSRSPLDDIASLMRSLTYGEMIELGEAIWKVKGEGEIAQGTLPGILHRWSKQGSDA